MAEVSNELIACTTWHAFKGVKEDIARARSSEYYELTTSRLPRLPKFSKATSVGEDNGYGGMITYGGFDFENCEQPVTYEPVDSVMYWQVRLLGVSAGEYFMVSDAWKAELDTATSFIRGPAAIISAIAKELGAQSRLCSFYALSHIPHQSRSIPFALKLATLAIVLTQLNLVRWHANNHLRVLSVTQVQSSESELWIWEA
ncbi:hypothetical protein ANCCEY_08927 [Ancylostoma ceylanicum]|uniref:Peptidase A1 domain-containing protein n=1 Tax=Ancylostoma ceylanicum TaxID=53326 RepID=A0A0D6LPN0_9BILA|nr:hypothetical protein ANCCEY_08927 [Ancylostoma ceylanicum]